jgi:8-oxo-dGTP pyrophosphatase MutT (NUDIX family)
MYIFFGKNMFSFLSRKRQPGFQRIFGTPLAYEVSVGAVVFRCGASGEYEYLLLRYPHGHWDYVKGHVEAGETYEETMRREILEESGLTAIELIHGFRKHTRYFYTAKGSELEKRKRSGKGLWIWKTVYFYLARVKDDCDRVAISDEHTSFAWLPVDPAISKLTFPVAKDILLAADAFLKKQTT